MSRKNRTRKARGFTKVDKQIIADLEKLLIRFRKLNVKNGQKGPNPHEFATALFLRDSIIRSSMGELSPRGDDKEALRWHLKLKKLSQKGHKNWMDLLPYAEPILVPGKKAKV